MEGSSQSPIRRAALAWVVLAGVTLAAYWPALGAGFIWDDDAHVTKPALRSLHGLWRIWFELGATQQYYPVLHSAFWVEHRLWGDAPLGYHLTNILLHATAAWLFGIVLMDLWAERVVPNALVRPLLRGQALNPDIGPPDFRIQGLTPSPLSPAWLAALIFALHPICVESVAWISEEKNTLSTVFYLLSALAYLHSDEIRSNFSRPKEAEKGGAAGPSDASGVYPSGGAGTRRPTSEAFRFRSHPSSFCYVLSLALFILAVLSKSVTATLPAALLVIFWWKRGTLSWKRDVLPLLPWFAVGLAGGLLTAWVERQYIGAQGAAFDLGLLQRCLLAGRAVCFYLGKLFWPFHLIFVYPRWDVRAGAWWQYLFPLGVLALLGALWSIRHRARGPLAAMLFFVGSLFPALGFFNVYPFIFSYVADHFAYLATLGIFTACGCFAGSGMEKVGSGRLFASPRRDENLSAESAGQQFSLPKRTRYFLLPAFYFLTLCALGMLTWRQCGAYRDSIALYRATLSRNPNAWMAHYNLGVVLARGGRIPEAIPEYERALNLKPEMAEIHLDLGTALMRAGRVNEAIAQFREAVRLKPGFADAHLNLGAALHQAGESTEAMAACEEALRLQPDYPEADYDLGAIYEAKGRLPEAIAHFERALRLRPDFPAARLSLADALEQTGIALAGAGRVAEAIAPFQEALQLNPGSAEAHGNLGTAFASEGRFAEATVEFREALRIDPGNTQARYNLGLALERQGKPREQTQPIDGKSGSDPR